ncbi:MAG: hypothetical protein AABX11_01360 [Nanoarchaeota archaeon]
MSSVRYKIKNHKRKPLCDYHGECRNLAYCEVYPSLTDKKLKDKGWSYLCRRHFNQERKRYKNKLVYCSIN